MQKQQETLIVWSEGDNFDLALSFQEKVGQCFLLQYLGIILILFLKAGCDEIWEKICSVQGKDPSVDFTQVSKTLPNSSEQEKLSLAFNFLCARTWLKTARMIEALTKSQKQLLQLNCQQLNSPDLRFCHNLVQIS